MIVERLLKENLLQLFDGLVTEKILFRFATPAFVAVSDVRILVQFPDLSLPAVCGIGSMLGIAGYQVIEIAIQRRFKGRGKP
ncbi:TPA: hypothetical protein L6L07_003232 [Escherichia coli]|nr:hypothetical protein [Escherichia coli]